MWDASPGGVVILARAALTAEAPPLPRQRERDPLVWDLWHSARWVHVRLALGDGSSALHLICVYGVYGDDALNRELWTSVAAHLARLGNAPLVVGADFNFPLGDVGAAPEPLLAALLTRRLVDLDLEFNKSQEACMCRFSPTGASADARIDGILADPRVATALEDVQAVRGPGILGHRPVGFSLLLSRATQRVWRAVRPPVISIPERPEEQRRNLEDCLLSPLAADWEAVLESADVDAVWAYWTWAAEEASLALSDPELQPQQVDPACPLPVAPRAAPSTAQRGRGTDALVRQVRMCPRQQPVTGLPETAPLARLHAAVGALRPVLNWRRTAPARPHVPPRAVEQAWRGARRRIQAVRALRLPGSDALPDLPRLGEVPIPAAEHLEATIRDLQRLVRDQARREDAARTSAWKPWLVEEMSVRPGAGTAGFGRRSSPHQWFSWLGQMARRQATSRKWTSCFGRHGARSTASTLRRPSLIRRPSSRGTAIIYGGSPCCTSR